MAFVKTKDWHINRIANVCDAIKGTIENIPNLDGDDHATKAHFAQALSFIKSLEKNIAEFSKS